MYMGVGAFARFARQAALFMATLLAMPAVQAADAQNDFRILYFEPFSLSATTDATSLALKTTDDPLLAGVRFDAYGRRFELELKRNEKVMQDPAATGVAYLGTLSQQPGSWTRLTKVGESLHGMIWDGAELYVVEPVDEARPFMVAPLDPAQHGTVIYRLSDTLVDLGPAFCSALDTPLEDPLATGLTTFKALASDLKSQVVLQQAAGASLGISVSALGDADFLARYATEAEARDAIMVRLNNVDGIFSAQLGVEIAVDSVGLYNESTDPFTSTTDAGDLLDELGTLRNGSPGLRADGLTHLFTGRILDDNILGMAYVDSLCRRSFGAGLTDSRGHGVTIESLIAAHEFGHNFGAVHDGSGECAATPANEFIMGPQTSARDDTFSECSVGIMTRSIARAGCVSPLPPPDASVGFAAPPADLTTGQVFSWAITVMNNGGQQAAASNVQITLPETITVDDATAPGGSCASGAGTVQCSLGPLEAGETRTVTLTLVARTFGVSTVTALASATNDTNTSNDSATASLSVDAPPPVSTPPPAPTSSAGSGGGGGGGGGSMGLSALLSLGLLAGARARRLPAR